MRALAIAVLLAGTTAAYAEDPKEKPAPEPGLLPPKPVQPVVTPTKPVVPDDAAVDAGNANIESKWKRRTTSVTFAIGAGLTVGLGMSDTVGGGGAGTLRFATFASERGLLTVELAGIALLHKVEAMVPDDKENRNDDTNILFGGMYYLNRALWIRASAGIGIYIGRNVDIDGDGNRESRTRLVGPAAAAGVGIEFLRLNHFAMGFEMVSISMLNREGILSSSGFMLGMSLD